MRFRRRYVLWLSIFLIVTAVIVLLFFRNYSAPVKSRVNLELVTEKNWPKLLVNSEDYDLESLSLALERNLVYLQRLPGAREFDYGGRKVRADKILVAQVDLLAFLRQKPDITELQQYLQAKFQLLESVSSAFLPGFRDEKPLLFTGYYVPTLHGSLKPDARYRYPLYKKPDDLVTVDLQKFNLQRYVKKLWPWLEGLPFGAKLSELNFPVVRGRLLANGKVVPHYSRTEIDYESKLEGQGLELLWVDDEIDRFFLQIQGSGLVRLESGASVMVGYSAANGHPYRSIGGWLIRKGLMKREKVSMPAIRAWLKAHPERRAEIFKINPSYVFFRLLKTPAALGCYQVPLTAYASIATDRRIFPGGALALISTERPLFSESGELVGWRNYQRLVVNQDTGGAIKGPFRVDIYCGADRAAEQMAGVMKQRGRLFFLLPKDL